MYQGFLNMTPVQLVIDSKQSTNKAANQHFFSAKPVSFVEEPDDQLEILIHQVSKTPKDLIRHSQRIYYCFFYKHSEHLFAALTDLLLLLQGKGKAFARRMVNGTQSLLTRQQVDLLQRVLKFNDFTSLQSIKFSLFASGRITPLTLIEKQESNTLETSHDVLTLAHDFIQYSQLDQAMEILEQAALDTEREDIQQLLLELYRSTKSLSRFSRMYQQLQRRNQPLLADWPALQQFFSNNQS
jgi:hypothetical protein